MNYPAGHPLDQRKGNRAWIQTASGHPMWPLAPAHCDIRLEDIAHSLANVCRWGGHTSTFYSVAQHSVLVSRQVPPAHARWGLLHDSPEAYLGDMCRPIKRTAGFGEMYQQFENEVMVVIAQVFGLPLPMPPEVKAADDLLLAVEARDLMDGDRWRADVLYGSYTVEEFPRIVPLTPSQAKILFLARYEEVTS